MRATLQRQGSALLAPHDARCIDEVLARACGPLPLPLPLLLPATRRPVNGASGASGGGLWLARRASSGRVAGSNGGGVSDALGPVVSTDGSAEAAAAAGCESESGSDDDDDDSGSAASSGPVWRPPPAQLPYYSGFPHSTAQGRLVAGAAPAAEAALTATALAVTGVATAGVPLGAGAARRLRHALARGPGPAVALEELLPVPPETTELAVLTVTSTAASAVATLSAGGYSNRDSYGDDYDNNEDEDEDGDEDGDWGDEDDDEDFEFDSRDHEHNGDDDNGDDDNGRYAPSLYSRDSLSRFGNDRGAAVRGARSNAARLDLSASALSVSAHNRSTDSTVTATSFAAGATASDLFVAGRAPGTIARALDADNAGRHGSTNALSTLDTLGLQDAVNAMNISPPASASVSRVGSCAAGLDTRGMDADAREFERGIDSEHGSNAQRSGTVRGKTQQQQPSQQQQQQSRQKQRNTPSKGRRPPAHFDDDYDDDEENDDRRCDDALAGLSAYQQQRVREMLGATAVPPQRTQQARPQPQAQPHSQSRSRTQGQG